MSTTTNLNAKPHIVLTQAQYDARKTAGTLVSGTIYDINDYTPSGPTLSHGMTFSDGSGDEATFDGSADFDIEQGDGIDLSYTAGGTSVTINAAVDGTTIGVNSSGALESLVTGATYTAGEGISITNNEIAVALETDGGLEFAADTDALQVDFTQVQQKLTSGTNIKTVNNNSLLGSGNISISATLNHGMTFSDGSGDEATFDGTADFDIEQGDGIDLDYTAGGTSVTINAAVDGTTIGVNGSGELYAIGGGSTTLYEHNIKLWTSSAGAEGALFFTLITTASTSYTTYAQIAAIIKYNVPCTGRYYDTTSSSQIDTVCSLYASSSGSTIYVNYWDSYDALQSMVVPSADYHVTDSKRQIT